MTPITVTRPALPDRAAFDSLMDRIWDSHWLTNDGPLLRELEAKLAAEWEDRPVAALANGSIALNLALRAAGVRGEVITTPFSFAATAHAIVEEGCTPRFVDLAEDSPNLDPAAVAAAITPRTGAILAVHCYGLPCDTAALAAIADAHALPLIYDCAHGFGVVWQGRPLAAYGDYSTLSFHATKTFSTAEGGAIRAPDEAALHRIRRLRNFGIAGERQIECVGTNAKMSELHAAFGLAGWDAIATQRAARLRIEAIYRTELADLAALRPFAPVAGLEGNAGYFPLRVAPEAAGGREGLYAALGEQGILSRRYFYPLLCDTPDARLLDPAPLPRARRLADEVLCLPIHAGLGDDDVARTVAAVRAHVRRG